MSCIAPNPSREIVSISDTEVLKAPAECNGVGVIRDKMMHNIFVAGRLSASCLVLAVRILSWPVSKIALETLFGNDVHVLINCLVCLVCLIDVMVALIDVMGDCIVFVRLNQRWADNRKRSVITVYWLGYPIHVQRGICWWIAAVHGL